MSIFEFEGDGSEDEATLYSLSSEYLEAAIILNENPPTRVNYWIVTYYLLGHAAELSLKSYLFKQGKTIKELVAIGHNLDRLIDIACEYGKDEFNINSIRELSPIYKTKKLEYRRKQRQAFPAIDTLIKDIKNLKSMVFNEVSAF